MITFRQSEIDDPPSCLDAAVERQAIMNGSTMVKVTFPENEKYVKQKTDEQPLPQQENALDCGWHMSKTEAKSLIEGMKFDDDKPDYSLLPPGAIDGVVRVFTMGAGKYGKRNWESGLRYGRLFAASMRHLWAWWRGEDVDPESGMSHLHHAACNMLMLSTLHERKMDKFDDRPR